jgi:hypothetical protein
MSSTAKLIINDPESFHVLTTDMKETIIKAAINKVNIQAARTRTKAIQNIKADFTVRNTFTARQVQYTQMPQGRYSLSVIQSTVGVTEKGSYMARQELGGVRRPATGKTLAIPTAAARGGSNALPVVRKNYVSRIKSKIIRPSGGYLTDGTHKARIVEMAAAADKKGGFLAINKKIFRVENFVKNDGGATFRLRQLYGFDRRKTITRPQPWLKPASEALAKQGEMIFISEMKKLGL